MLVAAGVVKGLSFDRFKSAVADYGFGAATARRIAAGWLLIEIASGFSLMVDTK